MHQSTELRYEVMTPSRTLTDVADCLQVPRDRPVLVIVGWAGAAFGPEHDAIERLLREVVAPICQEHRAVVLTGGTDAGVMAMTGKALAEFAPDALLVGVAPHRKLVRRGATADEPDVAAVEPHHTRFVGAMGADWGDEASTMIGIAERVATRDRLVMLVLGGGRHTAQELRHAVAREWPVLLVTGCGENGVSDALAQHLWATSTDDGQAGRRPDSSIPVSDILPNAADVRHLFATRHVRDHERTARALRWRLCNDELLQEAWSRYAIANRAADASKRPIGHGVALAIILATLAVLSSIARAYGRLVLDSADGLLTALLSAITGLPLLAALVLLWVNWKTRSGGWIGMRAAAETTLREIYRYRAAVHRSGSTDVSRRHPDSSEGVLLAQSLHVIDQRVGGRLSGHAMNERPRPTQGVDNLDPSPPPVRVRDIWPPKDLDGTVHPSDHLLCPIEGRVYDAVRVRDQIEWLLGTAEKEEKSAQRLAMTIGLLGAVAAFSLATAWREPLTLGVAAVATALIGALVTWREYRRQDDRADSYRATAALLRSSRSHWLAADRSRQNKMCETATYVSEVEDILAAENAGWERELQQSHRAVIQRASGR